ncbi:lysine--tRNA ligase [Reinekea marinisedimentorum]|uniref:Lysine--tRNA ligase n=1 Tax=Reinekea marinisedimentorum TaxID=230495 RepID=A0A4R3I5F9_9GAMM|nr:lysine--tRNA ligase [Reinekea marinisedimentorum]TCS40015.1 lysyl-tRNA synthetase class 2 [Reinekea marinisedimentorum]
MSDNTTENLTGQHEENHIITERKQKLAELQDKRGIAFPNDFQRENKAGDLQAAYGELEKEAIAEKNIKVAVAGRVMRRGGPFVGLRDVTGSIQFYLGKPLQKESDDWKLLDIGDIVGVSGTLAKSGKGELYVNVEKIEDLRILTKSLRPLPDKFHGLADQEAKYRQRYVDLMVSEQTRKVFEVRSKVVNGIRNYLAQRDFMEVETPMLQVIPGGATARPFITHHNAMDRDLYLRIAPELYLKRLVVGGFERVFEINRNFRNEGVSTRHNPEFTMLEWYQAYADYNDLMDLTEDMLRTVAKEVLGTTEIHYQGRDYDFAKPFERLSMFNAILKFNPELTAENINTLAAATEVAGKLGIQVKDSWGLGKVQTEIFEETVEESLMDPVFITEYPAEISPLARRNDENPEITDRFEFFLGGREIANGFSELNDPIDQAERFQAQVLEKDAGDDEAMFYDADYINALEYGLPPTAGEGIGIDRLVMFLTDSPSIKDVILFPHMKPKASE